MPVAGVLLEWGFWQPVLLIVLLVAFVWSGLCAVVLVTVVKGLESVFARKGDLIYDPHQQEQAEAVLRRQIERWPPDWQGVSIHPLLERRKVFGRKEALDTIPEMTSYRQAWTAGQDRFGRYNVWDEKGEPCFLPVDQGSAYSSITGKRQALVGCRATEAALELLSTTCNHSVEPWDEWHGELTYFVNHSPDPLANLTRYGLRIRRCGSKGQSCLAVRLSHEPPYPDEIKKSPRRQRKR